jgi:hypothetical protein
MDRKTIAAVTTAASATVFCFHAASMPSGMASNEAITTAE